MGFLLAALWFSGHPFGAARGPADLRHAQAAHRRCAKAPVKKRRRPGARRPRVRGCAPASVVESARLVGMSGRPSAARFAAAPKGPLWLVYGVRPGGGASAYAVDARTLKIVYDYRRVEASGGFRELSYLNVDLRTWALEGLGVLGLAFGIYRWARGAWKRTLLCLDGPLPVRVLARLHRLLYELVWGFALAALIWAGYYSGKTRAPEIVGSTVAGGAVVLVLWIYATFAVVRSGVLALELETAEEGASDAGL